MRAFKAFLFKEFCEMTRTYKLLIMGAVFLLFGMLNPITAKITPELLSSVMPSGMDIAIPIPTAIDSWMQFYKNVPQMGFIVVVIVFSGIMANEISKGTLINMLTKGLSRKTVVLAKFTSATTVYTAAYIICAIVTQLYTAYFWDTSIVKNLVFSVFCAWIYGVLLISSVILGGIIFKNYYGSMLFTGGVVVVMFLLSIPTALQKYIPTYLIETNSLITGQTSPSDFIGAIIITCAIIVTFIICSMVCFNKKTL